ncbi:hypothetical protein ACFQV8_38060 [Pseudonocardia benzenivorans]
MRDRLIGKGCGVAKSTPALAEPSALRWARESIAYIPVTASRKIGGPDDRVEQLRREAREAARRRSADMPSVAAQAVASLDAESSCRDRGMNRAGPGVVLQSSFPGSASRDAVSAGSMARSGWSPGLPGQVAATQSGKVRRDPLPTQSPAAITGTY